MSSQWGQWKGLLVKGAVFFAGITMLMFNDRPEGVLGILTFTAGAIIILAAVSALFGQAEDKRGHKYDADTNDWLDPNDR